MKVLTQRQYALEIANARRAQRAHTRYRLRHGDLSPGIVILTPEPYGMEHEQVWEVLLMSRGFGECKLSELNCKAMRDDVNLAQTCGKASKRTRTWIAERLK